MNTEKALITGESTAIARSALYIRTGSQKQNPWDVPDLQGHLPPARKANELPDGHRERAAGCQPQEHSARLCGASQTTAANEQGNLRKTTKRQLDDETAHGSASQHMWEVVGNCNWDEGGSVRVTTNQISPELSPAVGGRFDPNHHQRGCELPSAGGRQAWLTY